MSTIYPLQPLPPTPTNALTAFALPYQLSTATDVAAAFTLTILKCRIQTGATMSSAVVVRRTLSTASAGIESIPLSSSSPSKFNNSHSRTYFSHLIRYELGTCTQINRVDSTVLNQSDHLNEYVWFICSLDIVVGCVHACSITLKTKKSIPEYRQSLVRNSALRHTITVIQSNTTFNRARITSCLIGIDLNIQQTHNDRFHAHQLRIHTVERPTRCARQNSLNQRRNTARH